MVQAGRYYLTLFGPASLIYREQTGVCFQYTDPKKAALNVNRGGFFG